MNEVIFRAVSNYQMLTVKTLNLQFYIKMDPPMLNFNVIRLC